MKRRRKAQHTHLPRSGLKMCFLTRRLTFFGERRHHRGVIPPQPGAGCPPRSLTAHSPRRTNDPMFRTPFTRVTGNPPNSVQIAVCASVCVLTGLSVYPGSCTRQEAWSRPSRLSYFVSSRGPHGGFGKRHRDCTVLNPCAPDVRVRGRREAQPFGNKRVLSNCSGNEGTACPSRVSAGRFPTRLLAHAHRYRPCLHRTGHFLSPSALRNPGEVDKGNFPAAGAPPAPAACPQPPSRGRATPG